MALEAANLVRQTNAPAQQPQFTPQPPPKVPAFLNKLYALVNDPETDEYVHWNDAGTSFIIPNSQAMAENVLPRSFKTINFTSFVRQLNMYGFHKVPHLNDGALHTENAPEVCEFTNEFFTRENPDLPSIVRKKNEAERARVAKRQVSPEPKPRPPGLYPAIEAPGANLASPAEMSVVVEEIHKIKRLQNSVIGELKRLKTDNEALWTEAAEARQRYDQQQATINKMLKFLSTVFSPNKTNNAGSLASRNRGLITAPSPFEELSDGHVDSTVLTPEAQETGARELSNLFGGQQPILPANAGDASWWQNLVKTGNDNGLFNVPITGYQPQTDDIAPYVAPQPAMDQHRNSLAALEHSVNQTDQSIGRIQNALGINDWDHFNFNNNIPNTDGLTFDPFAEYTKVPAQPEYRFEDFIRNTDENGTILDQTEEENNEPPPSQDQRFQSLSREVTPKPKNTTAPNTPAQPDDGNRKRTRSQTGLIGGSPQQKRIR